MVNTLFDISPNSTQSQPRICILHQPERVAITQRLHGTLGRLTNGLWYVILLPALVSLCLIILLAALAYPYVLAFEPTFVEIRNVENGSMAQIIQGNNLRLLFADVPPSTTHTSNSSVSQNPYQSGQAGYGYNPYDYQGSSVGSSYSSRQSVNSQYGGPSPNGQFPTPNPYQRPSGFGREEIIMVSDDRVMTLRMAGEHPLPPVPASDGASVYSLPRG